MEPLYIQMLKNKPARKVNFNYELDLIKDRLRLKIAIQSDKAIKNICGKVEANLEWLNDSAEYEVEILNTKLDNLIKSL